MSHSQRLPSMTTWFDTLNYQPRHQPLFTADVEVPAVCCHWSLLLFCL